MCKSGSCLLLFTFLSIITGYIIYTSSKTSEHQLQPVNSLKVNGSNFTVNVYNIYPCDTKGSSHDEYDAMNVFSSFVVSIGNLLSFMHPLSKSLYGRLTNIVNAL